MRIEIYNPGDFTARFDPSDYIHGDAGSVHRNLNRQNIEIYYHKEHYECDFIIKEGLDITTAIQVTLTLTDDGTRKRELRGLIEAMNTHDLKEGLIITENEHELITIDDKTLTVKPIYEWLNDTKNINM